MQPGTARKPAARKRFSPQPSNFEGTLSHQAACPGPPGMTLMSERRKESSTAFFSHWFTTQPPSRFSATRSLPELSSSSAALDRLATSPRVLAPIWSRVSNAVSTSA